MAKKLPSAEDLPRRLYKASSPSVTVRAPDYAPIAKGAEAISGGIKALADAQGESDAHDVQRRLLDFKLETEMALEERRREMPVGGEGYSASWEADYRKRAGKFAGKYDENVPPALRGRVGTILKQHEVALAERARREELAERDRHQTEQLNGTLKRARSAIEADPNRLAEMTGEGETLIATAKLTPAARDQARRLWREQAQEAAAGVVADRVRDAESYARAREMLGPDRAERVTARGVKDGILAPGSWRIFDKDTPTPTERRQIRSQGGIVVNLDTNWAPRGRATEPMVVIPDNATPEQRQAAEAYAAGVATLYNRQFGASVKPRVLTRSQNGRGRNDTIHTEPFSVGDTRAVEFFASDAGRRQHAQILRETFGRLPGVAFSLPHDPTRKGDRGAVGPRGSEVDLAVPLLAEIKGGGSRRSAETDKPAAWTGEGDTQPVDGMARPEAYEGPFSDLSLAKRRALWQRAETRWAAVKTGTEQAIKSQMTVAADGYLPPAGVLETLRAQVDAIDDPMLSSQLDALERQAQLTQRLQKAPPHAIETFAADLRRQAAEHGATKETLDTIKHVETVAASTRRHLSDDALRHANSVNLVVPMADGPPADLEPAHRAQWRMPMARVQLEPIGFSHPEIDRMLAQRFAWAKGVGRYYGTPPPPIFLKSEAEALTGVLRQGGDGIPFIFGKIATAAAAAGIEPSLVMRQFSKDAPELAVIGEMVANNADPTIVSTAAAALSWRHAQGEKFVSTIDRLQAQPTLGEYAKVLAPQPMKVDAVRATANLLYEYESRRKGVTTFDTDLYKSVVRRIMGETTDGQGNIFGGVGTQGRGWADGKSSSKVLVPSPVRQDNFDDLVGALRARDLPDPPVDEDGKALSMQDIRSATWVSVGSGQYVLQRSVDADGTRVVARTRAGADYVLDVRSLLPVIQQRRPDIFRGYDGIARGLAVPDPDYAFGFDPAAKARTPATPAITDDAPQLPGAP